MSDEQLKREFQEWLESLGPNDVARDHAAALAKYRRGVPDMEAQLAEHLKYLRTVAARRVDLPNDAYFAAAREKINARVQVRPVSVWARFASMLLPEYLLRPLPRIVAGSAVVVALLLILVLQPLSHSPQLAGQQRYHDLMERFSFGEEVLTQAPLAALMQADELQRLFRSAAMLTSPSSLSRSWSIGLGQR